MKNLILPIALAAILLTACSKEESVEQFEEQNIDSVYVLNQFNETSYWDTMEVDEFQRSTDNTNLENSVARESNTRGHYLPSSRDAMIIQWAGSQTEQNTSGRAELKQSNPNFSFHFKLETECVMVDGNKAVYGGIITQVIELSGNAPDIGVGWRIYFNVIDNGEGGVPGGIVPYDQIANKTIFASPRSISLCNVYLPNDNIWSSQGYTEVTEPGFVVVNNYPTE